MNPRAIFPLLASLLLSSASLAVPVELRCQAPKDPVMKGVLEDLAKDAARRNADLRIMVLPSGAVVPESQIAEAVRVGTLDCGIAPTTSLENVEERFRAFRMPFAFDNLAHVEAVEAGRLGAELGAGLAGKGVALLAYLPGEFSIIASTKAVDSPARLLGARIAAPEIRQETLAKFGASVQSMGTGDARRAFTQGTIDAFAAPLKTIAELDGLPALGVTNHVYTGYALVMNAARLRSLPPAMQEALKAASAAASTSANATARATEKNYLDMIGRGRTIAMPSLRDFEGLRERSWQLHRAQIPGGEGSFGAIRQTGGAGCTPVCGKNQTCCRGACANSCFTPYSLTLQ